LAKRAGMQAGSEASGNSLTERASAGLLSHDCRLSLATGVVFRRLCRNRLGLLAFELVELLDDAARLRRVDLDPGAHRRRQRDLPDVATLRRGRLGADDLVEQRCVVLEQLALAEALLAERDVDVRARVGAVL